MSNYDNVEPKDNWVFDEEVTECFENMLERSIPQYTIMRRAVSNLVYSIITNKPRKETFTLFDLGCSNGLMLKDIVEKFASDSKYNGYYVGVDVSQPMLQKAEQLFSDNDQVQIYECDLTKEFPEGYPDVITSILTLQFIPINYRQEIIQNVYNNLSRVNGCFIMVEKVLGNTSKLNSLFVNEYHAYKEIHGYSKEQIERKRLSLEGVLVPVTNDWNIDLLRQAGFKQIDVFWRWMNFVGYIAIK